MGVRAVSHLAIGVRDMERSLVFWRDALGLEVAVDQIESFGGSDRFPARERRGVYLRWPSGGEPGDASFVVLDEQRSVDPSGSPAELFDVGLHHVGFWVDDLDEIADRLRAAGFDPMLGPAESDTRDYGEAPGGVVRTLFVRDPDGTIVQFDQRS